MPRHRSTEELRQQILGALRAAAPEHLKSNELSKMLGIRATDSEYDRVREVLEMLEEEGEIFRGPRRRYGVRVPQVVVVGKLERRGGIWLVSDEENPERGLAIEREDLWTAFAGDRVRAKLIAQARDEGMLPQGEVLEVVERGSNEIVGTLRQGRNIYLDPDSRDVHRTITVPRRDLNGAQVGDKVLVRLHEWNDPELDPAGRVVERLGRAGEMATEIAAIAAQFHLPTEFPPDVLAEAESFPETIPEEEIARRLDLRDRDIFTIDPADARDFDDAISIEHHEDGDVTLGIHIADVSYYVREGSALDAEALKRGTSVYLVTGVIPMLPERLSNNLCSLRPNEEKLTYSVLVRLSSRGAVKESTIARSIIRSRRRFTYEEAAEILERGEGDMAEQLLAINRVAHQLRAARARRGSIDFDRPEVRFRLDEKNEPVEVYIKRPTESTRLIEDCMLLANRVVAEFVTRGAGAMRARTTLPFIYRIHDSPPPQKLRELSEFVRTIGLTLPKENVQPKDIQKMLEGAKGRPEEDLVNDLTLRAMAKAVYSEHNIGHFGLAFQHYTHFTSPIRRYPDLIVHRMLDEYQHGMSSARQHEYRETLGGIADHTSERERAATEAERESIRQAEVRYLRHHVGDDFDATIRSILPFGMFAELNGLGIDGLIRRAAMEDDFYHFDEASRTMRGRNRRHIYRTGDSVRVRVVRVDEEMGEIDLEILGVRDQGLGIREEKRERKGEREKRPAGKSKKEDGLQVVKDRRKSLDVKEYGEMLKKKGHGKKSGGKKGGAKKQKKGKRR